MITNAFVQWPLKNRIAQHLGVTGLRYQLNLCSGSNVVKQHYLSHSAGTTHHLWYTNHYFLGLGTISSQSSSSQSAYLAEMVGWVTAAAPAAGRWAAKKMNILFHNSNIDTFSYDSVWQGSYDSVKIRLCHHRREMNAYFA